MHVFISYAKLDTTELATELHKIISELAGFTAWMDTELSGGQSWSTIIENEITKADVFIVLLSPDVNRSATDKQDESFVQREIAYALSERKFIMPIMAISTKVPISIFNLQYFNFVADKATGLEKLLTALVKYAEEAAEKLLVSAEVAESSATPPSSSPSVPEKETPSASPSPTPEINSIATAVPLLSHEAVSPPESKKIETAIIVALIGIASSILLAILGYWFNLQSIEYTTNLSFTTTAIVRTENAQFTRSAEETHQAQTSVASSSGLANAIFTPTASFTPSPSPTETPSATVTLSLPFEIITIDDFSISKAPISASQYNAFMSGETATPLPLGSNPNRPAFIRRELAIAYCSNFGATLPSVAQLERLYKEDSVFGDLPAGIFEEWTDSNEQNLRVFDDKSTLVVDQAENGRTGFRCLFN